MHNKSPVHFSQVCYFIIKMTIEKGTVASTVASLISGPGHVPGTFPGDQSDQCRDRHCGVYKPVQGGVHPTQIPTLNQWTPKPLLPSFSMIALKIFLMTFLLLIREGL